jgi:molybdopterin synthase sulfur carrier subunit
MQIHLRFFASLRETLATSQETISLPHEVKTVEQVREHLRARGGVWAQALADGRSVRMACNQQMAEAATPVSEGCELAFFPPVTGG